MATGIDWTGRRAQVTRARTTTDVQIGLPPTHRFCHSAIFRPITPYNVWFFWVSRQRSIILAKKMETFSGRFWEIPGNVLKLELLKMLIDHKNTQYSSKQSLKCLPEVFLTDEPNTNEKKQLLSISSSRFYPEKRKIRMFFRLFFRLSAHFRPHSSAIFHPNTPHNFLLPVISIW